MPQEENGQGLAQKSYISPELARFLSPAFLSVLENEIREKAITGKEIEPLLSRVISCAFQAGKDSR